MPNTKTRKFEGVPATACWGIQNCKELFGLGSDKEALSAACTWRGPETVEREGKLRWRETKGNPHLSDSDRPLACSPWSSPADWRTLGQGPHRDGVGLAECLACIRQQTQLGSPGRCAPEGTGLAPPLSRPRPSKGTGHSPPQQPERAGAAQHPQHSTVRTPEGHTGARTLLDDDTSRFLCCSAAARRSDSSGCHKSAPLVYRQGSR